MQVSSLVDARRCYIQKGKVRLVLRPPSYRVQKLRKEETKNNVLVRVVSGQVTDRQDGKQLRQ